MLYPGGIIAVTERDDTQVVIDALRGCIGRQRMAPQEAATWGVFRQFLHIPERVV